MFAEYNEKEFKQNYPQSYIRLKAEPEYIIVDTANIIKEEDVVPISEIFKKII